MFHMQPIEFNYHSAIFFIIIRNNVIKYKDFNTPHSFKAKLPTFLHLFLQPFAHHIVVLSEC